MKSTLISKLISKASTLTLAAVILSTAALSGCGQNNGGDVKNTTEPGGINASEPNDAADSDNNQDVSDPNVTNTLGEEDDTNPSQGATISNAVVVYKSVLHELDLCSFSCVSDLDGSGSIEPFTLSVKLSDIVNENGEPVDAENESITSIDIEFNGEIMETYPAQLGTVNRVIIKNSVDVTFEQMDEYEKLFSFDDDLMSEGDEQLAYIVEDAYVLRAEESWDGENATILAYAYMKDGGVYDLVEISVPKRLIKNEQKEAVEVSDIILGQCIEFAYMSASESLADSPVINVSDVDYFVVKDECVYVSEESLDVAMNAWEIE